MIVPTTVPITNTLKWEYEVMSVSAYLGAYEVSEIKIVFKEINRSIGQNIYAITLLMKTNDYDNDYEVELHARTLNSLNKIKRVAEDILNSFYGGVPRSVDESYSICKIEYISDQISIDKPKYFSVNQNPKTLRWSAVK